MADYGEYPYVFMMYAAKIVALRLMPAIQWTNTFVCLRDSEMKEVLISKYCEILKLSLS